MLARTHTSRSALQVVRKRTRRYTRDIAFSENVRTGASREAELAATERVRAVHVPAESPSEWHQASVKSATTDTHKPKSYYQVPRLLNTLCRLSFNPEITEAITLEKLPYHYCAVTGNVNLAAFLYSQKVSFSKGITIANFAADGKEGTTPWKKPVTLSPVDIADMAGKHRARVMSAISPTLAQLSMLYRA